MMKVKRVLMGLAFCGICLWMSGCTDRTAQEPDNIYNTYMAVGRDGGPAGGRVLRELPGGNGAADPEKCVSGLSCAGNIRNNNH